MYVCPVTEDLPRTTEALDPFHSKLESRVCLVLRFSVFRFSSRILDMCSRVGLT